MSKFLNVALAVACLAGASFTAAPVAASEVIGVHVGDLGVSVANGRSYDRHHHRHSYTYPTDWQAYNHPQSWYRGHSQWHDRNHADWYRN